jgi:hypothetical protein
MTGHDRRNRRTGSVVGDVDEVETERQLQLLSHQMRDRPGPSRAEGEFARTGLDQRKQLGSRFRRH